MPGGADDTQHSGIVINLPKLGVEGRRGTDLVYANLSPTGKKIVDTANWLFLPRYGGQWGGNVGSPFAGAQGTATTTPNPYAGMQNPRAWGTVSPLSTAPYGTGDNVTSYQGQPDKYYGNSIRFLDDKGGSGNNGMSADEAKWAGIAGKLGLNWQVVKDVYMNPNRNGTPNVSQAIERAADDKAWGDAAARFGILTGNAERDAVIWQEHYMATHYGGRDPMDGHNDAYQAYLNNQNALEQQANGTPQYPDWYKAP